MSAYNFFVSRLKFIKFSLPNVGGAVVYHAFPVFHTSIHSGDIRDQSLKLSEIATNFQRFLPCQILEGRRGRGPNSHVLCC